MKKNRQEIIIEIIDKYPVNTQEELTARLAEHGLRVTQATVSRDIRELGLTKVQSGGSYRYSHAKAASVPRFNSALTESVIRVTSSGNIIVIKTYPGLAQAVGSGIDALSSPEILGCVAGDDTIFAVTTGEKAASELCENIKHMMQKL